MRLQMAICTAALAALGVAPAAHASEVSLHYHFNEYHGVAINYYANLDVSGDGAERNDVTVTYTPGEGGAAGAYEIRDAAAPVDAVNNVNASPACEQVDDHTVRCGQYGGSFPQQGELGDYSGIEDVHVDLGKGADKALVGSVAREAFVHGGAGDDTLTATGPVSRQLPYIYGDSGADTLIGSNGDDLLVGGTGSDKFEGGAGYDVLGDDGNEKDVFDGGPDQDRVSYQSTKTPLEIDLGAGRGPDGDRYLDVEAVEGGRGADTLRGGAGPDRLLGGPGPDRIFGLGGDDDLDGMTGIDKVSGGAGNDQINSNDRDWDGYAQAEAVRCGPGTDVVTRHGQRDVLARDCERAGLHGFDAAAGDLALIQPLELHAGSHELSGLGLRCSVLAQTRGCNATITVRALVGKRRITLGKGSGAAGRGDTANVPVTVRSASLSALGSERSLRVEIEVHLTAIHLKSRSHPERGTTTSEYTARLTTVLSR
jgi:Ca2+-binding RTX toxin-like protein